MKTIREWLESIEDETIRQQALENAQKGCMVDFNTFKETSLSEAIAAAFSWVHTPQGAWYWDEIHTKVENGEKI